MAAPCVEFRNVSITFAGRTHLVPVLEDISFRVMPGEFVTIIGPSGSGKSTLFNLCVGLHEPNKGEILLDGQEYPERAGKVGYMPQRDLLLPWRNIQDNVIISQEIKGIEKSEARKGASAMFPEFGLENFENEYPSALSGGMRQRAALLRTWLTGSSTLLLDEPFGALDALTRKELQNWLLKVWKDYQRTILFITHDVEEAVYLADRVLVLSQRPATIQRELEINLPRPRHQSMTTEPEFGRLVKILLAELGVDY